MAELHLSLDTFNEKVRNAPGTALVDFWAPWCGPCKMLGPIITQLADEVDDSVLIAKVNIDDESELASEFGVMSIPTVILFRDGVEVERKVGLQSKQTLAALLANPAQKQASI